MSDSSSRQPPRAQPGGDTISLPSTVAPPGAERITLTISRVVVTGATVYSDAELAPLYADLLGGEVSLAAVYDLARRITAKYGAAGYVLSRAIVPPQNFGRHGAVIRIQVVEGYVDQVIWPVEKLTRYQGLLHRLLRTHHGRPAGQYPHARTLSAARERPARAEVLHHAEALADQSERLDPDRRGEGEDDRRDRAHRQSRHARRAGRGSISAPATVNNIAGSHEAFTVTYAGTFQLEELQYLQATYRQVLNSEGLTVLRQCELRHRPAGHRQLLRCSTTARAAGTSRRASPIR